MMTPGGVAASRATCAPKRALVRAQLHAALPTGCAWRSAARERVLRSFNDGDVLYLKAGKQQTRNGSDGLSPFRQEANFLYLTGVEFPEYECLLEAETGKFTLFVPELPEGMAVWVGAQPTFEELAERYGADEVLSVKDLATALPAACRDGATLFTLKGTAPAAGADSLAVDADTLVGVLGESRAVKLPEEIACLKHANDVSGAAHEAMWRACGEGSFEYQLEAVFAQHTMAAGLRHQGYPPIVGAGRNAATLHYEHNDQRVAAGDLVLVDAGAEYLGYTADITRTFPAGGRFSAAQRDLYGAVLHVQETALAQLRAGLEWESVTRDARRVATQCLLDLGVVRGSVDACMEADVSRLFMPHGLGHHLGLQVHDHGPTGPLPGRLVEGNVVTCEPGLYFVDSILGPALEDPAVRPFLHADALAAFAPLGGVRIEDDVAITAEGSVNLTSAAKQLDDVERLAQERP